MMLTSRRATLPSSDSRALHSRHTPHIKPQSILILQQPAWCWGMTDSQACTLNTHSFANILGTWIFPNLKSVLLKTRTTCWQRRCVHGPQCFELGWDSWFEWWSSLYPTPVCLGRHTSPHEPGFFWPQNKNVGTENLHGLTALRIYDFCGVGDSEVHWFKG